MRFFPFNWFRSSQPAAVPDAGGGDDLIDVALAAGNAARLTLDPAMPDLSGYAVPGTLRGQQPVVLGGMLDQFRQGYFGPAAAVFDVLEEREDAILPVRRKRFSKIRRELRTWSIQHDGTPEGERQATFLTAFYGRLRAEHALVPGVSSGIQKAATYTLDALGKKYSILAKRWSGRGENLSLTLRYVPLWHFQHRDGRFLFCDRTGGQASPIDLGQWLLASRDDHVMTACSILALFKRLPQQQMVHLLEKWGVPNVYGKVADPKGSKAFEAMKEAIAAFRSGWSGVVSGTGSIELLDAKPSAANLHLPWIQACNTSIAVLWTGGSLGTFAQKDTGALAGGAQADDLGDLIADDLVWLSETWQQGIDRDALYYGLGVTEPRAAFQVGGSSTAAMAEISSAVSMGLRISRNWLHKRMSIPEAEDDEEILAAPTVPVPVDGAVPPATGSGKGAGANGLKTASRRAAGNASSPQPPTLRPPATWAAPLLALLAAVAAQAADGKVTDAVLLDYVESRVRTVPSLLALMDVQALAEVFATGMLHGALDGLDGRPAPAGNADPGEVLVDTAVDGIKTTANPDAFERLLQKTPVTSPLRSAEWADVPLALRDRAQFSAGVESVRFLADVQRGMEQVLKVQREQLANGKSAYVDRSSFIASMRAVAEQEGLGDGTGGLTDMQGSRRLGLIYDMQRGQALGYAAWRGDQQEGALEAFPCQELIRVEDRKVPRDWRRRWAEAGGQLYGGRMIARKDDPVWMAISAFGTPWPPFDYGSGMGVEDVSREDAVALGVMADADVVEPASIGFNAALEASAAEITPELASSLVDAFGDQVVLDGDRAQWQGNLIGDLAREIIAGGLDTFKAGDYKGRGISFGQASAQAVAAAAKVTKSDGTPYDLAGSKMGLDAIHLHHIIDEHGIGRETVATQVGMKVVDLELIPHVWRAPDAARRGRNDRTLIMGKQIDGNYVLVAFENNPKQNDWSARSARIEIKKG